MSSTTARRSYAASSLVAALVMALATAGCTTGEAGLSAAGPSPLQRPPAANSIIAGRLPTVEYMGGRFLRRPILHTVTFTSDDPAIAARLEHFGDVITTSFWWREAIADYCAVPGDCIGPGEPGRHVRLDDRLPRAVTDIDVELLLSREAAAGRLGAIDANTLLIVYLPPDVEFGDASVPRYCDGPRALHQSMTMGQRRVPYAVVPRCGDFDQVTASASHEILEATTNPEPARRGFAISPRPAARGFTAAGVEPADPCGLLHQSQSLVQRDGFTVHRVWSNEAASRGTDPCVPAPADRPYLALVPEHPTIRLSDVGASATVTVEAAADRPVGPWSITASELAGRQNLLRYVDVALDRDRIAPGQRAMLTVTLRRPSPSGPIFILLVSTLDGQTHRWPLTVMAS